MKFSQFLHGVSVVTGVAGALSVLGAWIAGAEGAVFGWSQAHLFNDAEVLLLLSIVGGVGAIYHHRVEGVKK